MINLNFLSSNVDREHIRLVVEKLFSDYLNLKLGEVRFRELTYELADVVYEYPFTIPANFTYVMRAIMTLEGIGLTLDPNFSFFDVAKPYAKEFMLKREGRQFRETCPDQEADLRRESRNPVGQDVEAGEDRGQDGIRELGRASGEIRSVQTTKKRRTRRRTEKIGSKPLFALFVSSWF